MVVLFLYAFVSNIALAVMPHEPIVIWYGTQTGLWRTASVATLGTLAASWVDHRVLALLMENSNRRLLSTGAIGTLRRWFAGAPFLTIAVSGITPLPFWPFKALAFAMGYPMTRYLLAVAAGRFPRYLLLAWLGLAIRIPTWVLIGSFFVLLLPSLRMIPWPRKRAS